MCVTQAKQEARGNIKNKITEHLQNTRRDSQAYQKQSPQSNGSYHDVM
jgi:hypothetical protein